MAFPESDLDRLAELLSAPGRDDGPLPLDAIQGLFCAVESAPQPIPRERWLPAILGPGHEFAKDQDALEATALLTRFHDATAESLNAGEGFDLVLYQTEEGGEDLAIWCEGYLMGVELAEPGWDDAADPDEVGEMLHAFVVLSGRAKEFALADGEPWMEAEEEKRLLAELGASLMGQVLDNRAYWFEKNIPGTVRRDAPKVGRNDACPCGSGKKFKNCHGA
jgi:uncharacterized protein